MIRPARAGEDAAVRGVVHAAYRPYIARIGYAETRRINEKGYDRLYMTKRLTAERRHMTEV